MGADFSIVRFGHAKGVDALDGNAGALKKFGRVGMGSRDVGREAVTFIEPVGLAKFADNGVARGEFAQHEFAHFTDIFGEGGAGLPVNFGQPW